VEGASGVTVKRQPMHVGNLLLGHASRWIVAMSMEVVSCESLTGSSKPGTDQGSSDHNFVVLELSSAGEAPSRQPLLCLEKRGGVIQVMLGFGSDAFRRYTALFSASGERGSMSANTDAARHQQQHRRNCRSGGRKVRDLLAWLEGPLSRSWEPYAALAVGSRVFAEDVRQFLTESKAIEASLAALRKDRASVVDAVMQDGASLRFADESLQADPYIVDLAATEAAGRLGGAGMESSQATLVFLAEHRRDSTTSAVLRCLDDSNVAVRCAALEVLRKISQRGDDKIISAAAMQLKDDQQSVRAAAALVVPRAAPMRSKTAITMLCAHLNDAAGEARCAVLEALGELCSTTSAGASELADAAEGVASHLEAFDGAVRQAAAIALGLMGSGAAGAAAVAAASRRLEHHEAHARDGAVLALVELAAPRECQQAGPQRPAAVAAAGRRLEHPEWAVRRAAIDALVRIAGGESDEAIVAAACTRLANSNWQTRQAACEALALLAPRGDPRVISGVSKHLQAQDKGVQQSALELLGRLWCKGDLDTATATFRPCLEATDPGVRRAAVLALSQAAAGSCGGLSGGSLTEQALSQCLEDVDWNVRVAALRAYSRMSAPPGMGEATAPPGMCEATDENAAENSTNIIPTLAAKVDDASMDVRHAAVDALILVAGRGNAHAVASMVPFLSHHEWDVRWVAIEALPRLAVRGDAVAVAACCRCLEDAHFRVRFAAVDALAQLAERGDTTTFSEVQLRMDSENELVRRAAVTALPHVVYRSDSRAIAALHVHLQDEESCVRQAATEALAEINGSKTPKEVTKVHDDAEPCSMKHPASATMAAA